MDLQIHVDVAGLKKDVKHLDDCVDDLKKQMFGDDQQSGIIGSLREEIGELRKDHRKLIWVLVCVAFVAFSSGNGTLSLKSLLELLKIP